MFSTNYSRCILVTAALMGGAPASCRAEANGKVLFNFTNETGRPSTGLTKGGDVFYGATYSGGAFDRGTVFSVTKAGVFSVIYSFGKLPDANKVFYPLIYKAGALYGVSEQGGNSGSGPNHYCKHESELVGCGTVFKVTPGGQESILYAFSNTKKSDGFAPYSSLVTIGDKFYGTTNGGGANNHGTIFSVTMEGQERTLYSFTENDGYSFALAVMNGVLYGATTGTCMSGTGALFSLTTKGVFTVLHRFDANEGYCAKSPMLPLNGVLYGTTTAGGAYGVGTLFTLTPDGVETVLASLDGWANGPHGNIVAKGSKLYSYAYGQGASGTIFRTSEQDGSYKKFFKFGPSNGGFIYPLDGLVLSGGDFYGTAMYGGTSNLGAVFQITR